MNYSFQFSAIFFPMTFVTTTGKLNHVASCVSVIKSGKIADFTRSLKSGPVNTLFINFDPDFIIFLYINLKQSLPLYNALTVFWKRSRKGNRIFWTDTKGSISKSKRAAHVWVGLKYSLLYRACNKNKGILHDEI